MANDDVIVLCDPGVLNGGSKLRSRTLKSGAVKYSIEVESTPLVLNFNAKDLGAPVVQAMAEALRRKVRGIAATVSEATQRAREGYAKGFAKGTPSSRKRYAGGRTGAKAPNQSDRAFNDSGRFADGIVVGPGKDNTWHINVPSNRLDPQTAGGELAVHRIFRRLVQLVPEFGDPRKLFGDQEVQRGLRDSIGAMIIRAEARRTELTAALANAKVQAIRQLLGLLAA